MNPVAGLVVDCVRSCRSYYRWLQRADTGLWERARWVEEFAPPGTPKLMGNHTWGSPQWSEPGAPEVNGSPSEPIEAKWATGSAEDRACNCEEEEP